jgi:proline racemase
MKTKKADRSPRGERLAATTAALHGHWGALVHHNFIAVVIFHTKYKTKISEAFHISNKNYKKGRFYSFIIGIMSEKREISVGLPGFFTFNTLPDPA